MHEIRQIWPNWQVEEVLGEGGFGKVYKAKREDFGDVQHSAIKVVKIPRQEAEVDLMKTSGLNEESIKKYYYQSVLSYVDEIKMMGKLKSASHIVSIEDYEVVENKQGIGWTIYIRMELLTNIASFAKMEVMSTKDVVKMGMHLLTALEYCHGLNIMHRDIKPGNIFISAFGEYKLGDFGISREVEKSNALMSQKGTISYMAPEMIRLGKYGKNVDLYALGLTMYELLNHGRMPFLPHYPEAFYPRDLEEAMMKRLTGAVFPEIEGIGQLNEIIQKACHYDPNQRYQTATEMKEALSKVVLEDQGVVVKEKKHKKENPKTATKGMHDGDDFILDQKQTSPYMMPCPHCQSLAYRVFSGGYHCLGEDCYRVSILKNDEISKQRQSMFVTYMKEKDPKKRLEYALELEKLDPHSEEVELLVSHAYRLNRLEKERYQHLQKALAINGENAACYHYLGLYYHDLKNHHKAFENEQRAIELYETKKASSISPGTLYMSQAIYAELIFNSRLAFQSLCKAYQHQYPRKELLRRLYSFKLGSRFVSEIIETEVLGDPLSEAEVAKVKQQLQISQEVLYAFGPRKKRVFKEEYFIDDYTVAFNIGDVAFKDENGNVMFFGYYAFDKLNFDAVGEEILLYSGAKAYTVKAGEHAKALVRILKMIKAVADPKKEPYTMKCPHCGKIAYRVFRDGYHCDNKDCHRITVTNKSERTSEIKEAYRAYLRAKESSEKINHASRMIELDATSYHSYIYLARAYNLNKDTVNQQLRFSALQKALLVEDQDAIVYNRMAIYYCDHFKYEKAIEYSNKAIEALEKGNSSVINPTVLYKNHALYLEKAGNSKEAYHYLQIVNAKGFDIKELSKYALNSKIGFSYCKEVVTELMNKNGFALNPMLPKFDDQQVRKDLKLSKNVEVLLAIKAGQTYTFALTNRGMEYSSIENGCAYIDYYAIAKQTFALDGTRLISRNRSNSRTIEVGKEAHKVLNLLNEIKQRFTL